MLRVLRGHRLFINQLDRCMVNLRDNETKIPHHKLTRQAVTRLYTNMGHPQGATLAKTILDTSDRDDMVKCAARHPCSTCRRASRPRIRGPAAVPRTRQFNDTPLADMQSPRLQPHRRGDLFSCGASCGEPDRTHTRMGEVRRSAPIRRGPSPGWIVWVRKGRRCSWLQRRHHGREAWWRLLTTHGGEERIGRRSGRHESASHLGHKGCNEEHETCSRLRSGPMGLGDATSDS